MREGLSGTATTRVYRTDVDNITCMALHERDFFVERAETRPMSLACPKCGHREEYPLKWMRRTKKDRLPAGADERDRALFAKLADYVVRVDDFVTCTRCRRRFDIPAHRSMALSQPLDGLPKDDDEEIP